MEKSDFYEKVFLQNEYEEILKEVEKEIENSSDRGIALICGSILDSQLRENLINFLLKSDKLDKDLFKGNGPLATFDSKIKMSFYLGLISKHEMNNLIYLQRIRNKFAHLTVNISFDNDDIKNMCSNFSIPKNAYSPLSVPFPDKSGNIPIVDLNPIKKETTARERYIYTFRYLYFSLVQRMMRGYKNNREEIVDVITAEILLREQIEQYEKNMKENEILLSEIHERIGQLDEKAEIEEIEKLKKIHNDSQMKFSDAQKYLKPIINTHEYVLEVIKKSISND
jgi:DNA-binding MltR family transcriptional regulator